MVWYSIAQHLGTKRLQNKLVTTLEFHESIDHQAAKQLRVVPKC